MQTVRALANMKESIPSCQAHFNIGLNVELTSQGSRSLISVLEDKVSKKEAVNAGMEILEPAAFGRERRRR